MFTRILGVLFFSVVGLTAVPAQATSIGPYTYDIDGQLSIVGNDVCSPSPCTETVHFAFRFQWVETGVTGLFQVNVLPGFTEILATGPLGDSWRTVEGLFYSEYYFPMLDTSGNEIDLDMPNLTFTETPWIGPTFYAAELYACRTQICVTDFVRPDSGLGDSPPLTAIFLGGPLQYTATAVPVPELSTLFFLLAALLGVVGWRARQRKTGTA
jgi:hypothetical protein